MVNFVLVIAYYFCMTLPAAFTQPRAHLLADAVQCNVHDFLSPLQVTAVFFAVRNYWRGFFSSVIGSIFFRLISVWLGEIGMIARVSHNLLLSLKVWLGEIDTLIAVFPTGFSVTFPFDVLEIYMFIFIGVICGFGGAFYVYSHRR